MNNNRQKPIIENALLKVRIVISVPVSILRLGDSQYLTSKVIRKYVP